MSTKELLVGEKPLSSLRVVDLKEELEKRGLSKSGSKKDLSDRLKNFIIIQKQKEEPPAADEEQLPNISMQEKLAEQNPFIRDYFASQAELFHSQKATKKLLEQEEARRESEASAPSADEGGDNSAPEDKSPEAGVDLYKGKVRKLAKRFEYQNKQEVATLEPVNTLVMTVEKPITEEMSVEKPITEEMSVEKPITEEMPVEKPITEEMPIEKPITEELPEISLGKSVEITVEDKMPEISLGTPKLTIEEKKIEETIPVDKVEKEAGVNNCETKSESKSPIKSPVKHLVEEEKVDSDSQSSSKSSSPPPEIVKEDSPAKSEIEKEQENSDSESSSDEDKRDKKKVEEDKNLTKNGNVKKLAEQFENSSQNDLDKVDIGLEKETVEIVETAKNVESASEEKEKDEADSDSDSSKSSSRSGLRSPPVNQRAVENLRKRDASPQNEDSIKEQEGKVRKLTEHFEKKSSEDAVKELNKIEIMDVDEPLKSETSKDKEAKEVKKELKETPEPIPSKPKTVLEIRNHRKPSTASEVIDDEEALDYGEEEKIKSEPDKFDWTRRILRLKNKHAPKEHSNKRWQRRADKASENINTEFLIQFFPEVKLVSSSELKLEEKEKSPPPSRLENVEIIRKFSIDSTEMDPHSAQMENITITRKVSLVPMIPSRAEEDEEKDLSPARYPPSEFILITNLTRPFTLPQLKELLQRTGTLQDVWVDKIKSRCIAKYEKQEEAFETRAALHGVNWPQSNPKTLYVDYTTQDRLDDYKARDSGVEVKPVKNEKPATAENMPVREWDLGKKGESPNRVRRSSRSLSRDRKRRRSSSPSAHRRRHSRSPHHDHRSRGGEMKDPEPLGKALDELFRKTIAIPSIYWLPLSNVQISEKEELRRKRMIERERRLAELNKMRPR